MNSSSNIFSMDSDFIRHANKTLTGIHYYGDIVRKLFLGAAIFMLILMPFFTNYIPFSIQVGLIIVVGLSIFAGLTNPKVLWLTVFDLFISLGGVFLFGYYAIEALLTYGITNAYFWANEVLGITFLVALYYSMKTVRGYIIDNTTS